MASLLMFLNVTLLMILVPGGPIENRDFKHLKGVVFWGFNLFLIILGIASFIVCYLLLVSHSYAVLTGQILAGLYFIVYMVDLAGVFPKSPTKMSRPLMLIEIINISMAVFLFLVLTAMDRVL